MKNLRKLMVGLMLVSGAGAVSAAEQPGWYGGFSLGRGQVSSSGIGMTVDGAYAGQGLTTGTQADSDNSWRMHLGYQFNENFGVEGGYGGLGRYKLRTAVIAPAASFGGGEWKVDDVWTAALVGTLPLGNQFSAFGQVGLAYANVSLTGATPAAGGFVARSSNETTPMLGLGLKYDLTKTVAMRAEWQRYQNVGSAGTTGESNINNYSVGLQFKF